MSVVLSTDGIFPPIGFGLNQYANIHKFDLIINDPQQRYTVSLFCDAMYDFSITAVLSNGNVCELDCYINSQNVEQFTDKHPFSGDIYERYTFSIGDTKSPIKKLRIKYTAEFIGEKIVPSSMNKIVMKPVESLNGLVDIISTHKYKVGILNKIAELEKEKNIAVNLINKKIDETYADWEPFDRIVDRYKLKKVKILSGEVTILMPQKTKIDEIDKIINKRITDHFMTREYLGIKSDEVVLNDKLTNDEIDIISAYGVCAVEADAESYTRAWLEMLENICL